MPASRTDVIPKRDLHFDLSSVDLKHWHPAGELASHHFNVQSLLFPQGERFFIRSVRHYRDRIVDPVLQQQVAGFIAQEAMHGREHEAYNAALARAGVPVAALERWVGRLLWLAENTSPPSMRLAMTAALEHLTAIGAELVLEDERILKGATPEMARLWTWHALEETEHKAVAFDVYREIAGTGFLAWLQRAWAMLNVSLGMHLMVWGFLITVAYRNGRLLDVRGWGGLLWKLWVSPGAARRQVRRYFAFFLPGFHPWQTDTSGLVRRWQAAFASQAVQPTE